jgi:hypothetical protein
MNYKQKKHFRQNLDFDTATSNTHFFLIFQLKNIDVLKWIFLKKSLLKYNLKSKIFSIKSFQKNNFFVLKSDIIKNMYNGQILIIYPKDNSLCFFLIKKILFFFKDVNFLIFIHIVFDKKFFSFKRFETLIKTCLKNSKIELIQVMLHLNQFVVLLDNTLYNCIYNLKRII